MELKLAEWGFSVNNSVVRKYIESIHKTAADSGSQKQVRNELNLVKECILSFKNHEKFLKRISLLKNEGVKFIEFLNENFEISEDIYNFMFLLLDNNRFDMILDIADAYSSYLDKLNGKKIFYITFARDVSKNVVNKMQKNLQEIFGGQIECIIKKDESLIDGVKLQHNSRILDYSLKSRLRRLHSAIRGESYEN